MALGHLDAYKAEPSTLYEVFLDAHGHDEITNILQYSTGIDRTSSSIDMLGSLMEPATAHFLEKIHDDPTFHSTNGRG